jgi:hypothetical protein
MTWLNWVVSNKDWLFAGCGLSLGSVVMGTWRWWRGRSRKGRSRETSLDEIVDQVNKLPAVQQSAAWSTYAGLVVTVSGRLLRADRGTDDRIHVQMESYRHNLPVSFYVSRTEHPRLVSAARNSRLVVVGKLVVNDKLGASYPAIRLTDVTTVDVL